jgi:hypothetical protein
MFILSPLISDQFHSFLASMNRPQDHESDGIGILGLHQDQKKRIDRLNDVLVCRQRPKNIDTAVAVS